ncbi:hypothetical protein CO2235_MP120010 [Cupriavidus oxalaticus]|uniref:Uncharacterized protein n=1 Tax=Cupriavidus oxalaticus TaxID=96344 RepID=A0A976GBY5_9BURK|nr:hypothetical protein CO2235_MP120010 [Cupriavidus oxalaticus]
MYWVNIQYDCANSSRGFRANHAGHRPNANLPSGIRALRRFACFGSQRAVRAEVLHRSARWDVYDHCKRAQELWWLLGIRFAPSGPGGLRRIAKR